MTTFQQIKPGPRPADEPNGSSDILSFFNLRRLHDLTQSGTFVSQQQEQARAAAAAAAAQQQQASSSSSTFSGGGIPGDARLWKRGAATGLSPLASKPAPSVPAGSRSALATQPLARSLAALERGPWSLSDGARGELVAEGAGEESAAAVLLPAPAAAAAAAAAAASVRTKEEGGAAAAAAAPPAAAAATAAAAGAPSPGAARPAAGKIKIKVKLGPKKV